MIASYKSALANGFQASAIAALLVWPWIPTQFTAHDQARFAQVLLSATAALFLLLSLHRTETATHSIRRITGVAACALLILALGSATQANDSAAALLDVGHHLGLLSLVLAFSTAFRQQPARWFERGLMLAPLVIGLVMAAIYAASWVQGQPLNARQMHVGFDNPRFLNHAQTLFVPWLVLVFPLGEHRRAWRQMAWLAAVVHVAFAYLDVARGTWLAWSGACVVLWLHGARSQCRQLVVVLSVGLLAGVLITDLLPAWGAYSWVLPFASKATAGGAHSRDQLLTLSLQMILHAPWLGNGGMSFAAIPGARGTHPHNIYFQWAAEYGVPAMLLAVSLLVAPLLKASKQIRRGSATCSSKTPALLAVCAGAFIDALVSGSFVMPVAQLWIALAWGQLIAATGTNGQNPPHEASAPVPFGLQLSLAAALCLSQMLVLWASVYQGLRAEPRIRESTPTIQPGEKPRPRYWLNGQL